MSKLFIKILAYIFSALACANLMAADVEIKSWLDQKVIGQNQQFTLNVEVSGSEANRTQNPQLPDMDKFSQYLGSGSSQNISYVNGKMSVSKVLKYHFRAKTIGSFTIGTVQLKHKGKIYQTDPINIQIQKSAAKSNASRGSSSQRNSGKTSISEKDLYLKTLVSKKTIYPNEPVVVTFKLYTKVNVNSFNLLKQPGTAGFWVEDVDIGKQLQAKQEVINGERITTAIVRQMVLFPTSSGEKTIEAMQAECGVRVQRRSRNAFDSFFDDSFFYGRTTPVVVQTKPVKINVLPLPETGKPADFNGAVGQFTMQGKIDKSSAKTNEAINYTLKIRGKGNIKALPDPVWKFPATFEQYPPKSTQSVKSTVNGVTGEKTYEVVLVPREAGTYHLEPVSFSYFDPSQKAYRTLTTDELSIQVAKGKETYTTVASGLTREEVKLLGQDIRFVKTELMPFYKMNDSVTHRPLFWIVLIFPLISLGMAMFYRGHINKLEGDVAYARNAGATRKMKKRLALAKSKLSLQTQKEFYSEIGKSIQGFLGDKLNLSEAGMMSDDVSHKLSQKGVSDSTVQEYFEILSTCDMKRFSPSETREDEMLGLYKRAENILVQLDRELRKAG